MAEADSMHVVELFELFHAEGVAQGIRYKWAHDPEKKRANRELLTRPFNGDCIDD